jgi:hypothetical protein
MVGLFTARAVWTERLASNHSVWNAQAQYTAEAALETALAVLLLLGEAPPARLPIRVSRAPAPSRGGFEGKGDHDHDDAPPRERVIHKTRVKTKKHCCIALLLAVVCTDRLS